MVLLLVLLNIQASSSSLSSLNPMPYSRKRRPWALILYEVSVTIALVYLGPCTPQSTWLPVFDTDQWVAWMVILLVLLIIQTPPSPSALSCLSPMPYSRKRRSWALIMFEVSVTIALAYMHLKTSIDQSFHLVVYIWNWPMSRSNGNTTSTADHPGSIIITPLILDSHGL